MRNRAIRREKTESKYISRIKDRLYSIWFKDEGRWRPVKNWVEAMERCKWVKMLKHGKIYGRSTSNVIWKHERVKQLRKESRQYEREAKELVEND